MMTARQTLPRHLLVHTQDVEHLASAECSTTAILVVGGEGSNGPLSSAELYDATSNTWRSTGGLSYARSCLRAVVQQQHHRVLAIRGRDDTGALSTVEAYDCLARPWSICPSLAVPRESFQAVLTSNGRVLAAGGVGPEGASMSSAELYDPHSQT